MKKRITILTSFVLTFALLIVGVLGINYSKKGNYQLIRNVELDNSSIVDDNYFNAFDSYDLVVENNKSTFDGYANINFSELTEIDNIASVDILKDATLKFSSSFDYNSGVATLNVYIVDESEEVTIIDTIYGVALLAETGEVDVLFDFDGELIFLSELRDFSTLDNVGWFTNLVKKAVNKVVTTVTDTVSTVTKVLSTPNGKIGTVCSLAACAVVGAACAFIPGGQIVTTLCAGIAGAVVGEVGFELTAKAAQQQNSSITDEDITRYGTLGSVIGSTVSVASCNVMTTWKTSHNTSKTSGNESSTLQTTNTKIKQQNFNSLPDNVQNSIKNYEINGWKGNYSGQTPGTKAGQTFKNSDGILPSKTSTGDLITYKEFDVNNYMESIGRDAERLIKGSDGKLYYTNDHYSTFIEVILDIINK